MPWQTGWHRDAGGRISTNSVGIGTYYNGVARLPDGTARMTLAAPVITQNGYPVDAAGNLAVTTTLAGSKWLSGFLRAPNGALVVTLTATKWDSGYMRGPNGELAVTAVA